MMGSIIAGILIIIVLLALLGLGWDTFVSGVKRGADKVGITPIVQRVVEIVENGTRNIKPRLCMAKAEYPEKYNWWLNELDSLGISTLQKNEFDNQKEASDLTESVKQTLYEEYLQAYSESNR